MTTQTIKLPNKVIKANWKDDIDYEPYTDEKTYISPKSIKRATITKIKQSPIKLAIRNMVDISSIISETAA